MNSQLDDKLLVWVGSLLKDLRGFPEEVKDEIEFTLYQVHRELTPRSTKPLKGFTGAIVLEIVDDFRTDLTCTIWLANIL